MKWKSLVRISHFLPLRPITYQKKNLMLAIFHRVKLWNTLGLLIIYFYLNVKFVSGKSIALRNTNDIVDGIVVLHCQLSQKIKL
jgi:hypothetical protein